jgi:hypothetical protein
MIERRHNMPRKVRPAPANWSRNGEPDVDVKPDVLSRGLSIMQDHDAQRQQTIDADLAQCSYCHGPCCSPIDCGRRRRAAQQQARLAAIQAEREERWRIKYNRKNATLY